MIPHHGMDFIDVLENAAPLLEACICDNIPALRQMRLVCKKASEVSLLALKSYPLRLTGRNCDTNVNGAGLLRTTRLKSLQISMRLTGVRLDWVCACGYS